MRRISFENGDYFGKPILGEMRLCSRFIEKFSDRVLAGAFHGLGPFSVGEWESDGAFMTRLLAETAGGGGETPYGTNDPTTPEPAHNIRYFCGVARGDFIDSQNPGTGKLAGAINRDYDFGPADVGHEKIKESQVVFDDFL